MGSWHCVKSVQIRNFFWSVFSYIRTEYEDLRSTFFWSVFSCIQAEYGNLRSRFFWFVFSCIQSKYRKNKDQKKLRIWTLFTQSDGRYLWFIWLIVFILSQWSQHSRLLPVFCGKFISSTTFCTQWKFCYNSLS